MYQTKYQNNQHCYNNSEPKEASKETLACFTIGELLSKDIDGLVRCTGPEQVCLIQFCIFHT